MIVIGNGESRLAIDLSNNQTTKIGCNAVCREFFVDHLVCVDKRMLAEIKNTDVYNFDSVYTRPDYQKLYKELGCLSLPDLPYTGDQRWDDPFHWGSGPYAVLLAAKLADKVEMIGFDLWSETKFVNNCYKDTDNYDASNKRAVDPRYWIHQIGRVFEWFPQTEFTVYQTPNWQLPTKWNRTNVHVDKISNFTYTKHCGL